MSTPRKNRKGNISKWYLTRVGWFDVVRYPGALIASSFVVAGICLPLLLLIGLKRGLVEQFIIDISKSPTARILSLWVVQEKNVLTPDRITKLVQKLPNIEIIIPSIKKIVKLQHSKSDKNIDGLTILSTDESDPYMAAHKVRAPRSNERSLVLSKRAAEQLDVNIGDTLQMEVTRSEGTKTGRVQIDVEVKGILETGGREESVGYAHWKLLERIEEYQRGEAIPEFGWPSFQTPIRPRYICYLCFSHEPLTSEDKLRLKARGLRADFLTDSEPNDPRLNLYGLLQNNTHKYLYAVKANTTDIDNIVELNFTASEIEAMLDTSVVAISWNEPVSMELAGKQRLCVGLTLNPQKLKVVRNSCFEADEPENRVAIPALMDSNKLPKTMSLKLDNGIIVNTAVQYFSFSAEINDMNRKDTASDNNTISAAIQAGHGVVLDSKKQQTTMADLNDINQIDMTESIQVDIAPEKTINVNSQPQVAVAVVPAVLLSHLHQFKNGKARFDNNSHTFVRLKSPVGYYQARIFARTLEDVPILHKELLKQFAVESNLTRILEMQNYAHILKMLVNVVGCVVFAFGLFTVTLLLSDITSRKKGDIGILSCMGIPKWAAVYFVIIRATLIGTLGCLIAYVSSIAISLILSACNVRCAAPIYDLWWLLPFSIICCWAGAVVPAWRAVLLDPVKCLLEGKL